MEQSFVIQKKKLYEEVLEQISLLIKREEFKAGDRIPSLNELSSMFHVGKPTVREALSVLETAGVLEIRHGSGIFIRKFTQNDVSGVTSSLEKVEGEKLLFWLEYRRAVEVEVAGLAAIRRNEFDIKSIEEALHYLEEETMEEKVGVFWEYEFHHRIALASHNPIFAQAVTTIEEILRQYHQLGKKQNYVKPSRSEVVSCEHKEIMDAIIKGQPIEAKRAMLNHIENVQKRTRILSNK